MTDRPLDRAAGPARPAEPALIAHACNSERALQRALETGVDAIEADVWLEGDRLTLRHEIKLPHLPLLVDRWYVRRARGLLDVEGLGRAVDGRTGLFLDLKSRGERMLRAVARAIEALGHPRVEVSSRHWGLLESLRQMLPGLSIWYSAGSPREVRALLDRLDSGRARPRGVSLRHTLLDPGLAARLRDAGLGVYTWIVPDPDHGQRLTRLGADGLIADDVALWSRPGAALVPVPVSVRP